MDGKIIPTWVLNKVSRKLRSNPIVLNCTGLLAGWTTVNVPAGCSYKPAVKLWKTAVDEDLVGVLLLYRAYCGGNLRDLVDEAKRVLRSQYPTWAGRELAMWIATVNDENIKIYLYKEE